jgi:PAS domain S-box-containing protein
VQRNAAVVTAGNPGSVVRPDLTYIYVNPAWQRNTGYTSSEALQSHVGELVASVRMDSSLLTQLQAKAQETNPEQKGLSFHSDAFIYKRKDGTEYDAEVAMYPVHEIERPTFHVVIHRDITKKKKVEREYRTIADNFPNGAIALLDTDLRYVIAGGSVLRDIGFPRESLEGKTIQEAFPPEMLAINELPMKQALQGIETTFDMPLKGRLFRTRNFPVKDGLGQVTGIVSMALDVTKDVARDQIKSDFISLASHQLRSPLTAMRWILSRLRKEDQLTAAQHDLAERAYRAAIQMGGSIRTMLTISEVDGGRAAPHFSDVRLLPLIQEIVSEQQASPDKKVTSEVVCEDIVFSSDEQFLKEILWNLLSNAYKYSSNGGKVSVSVHNDATGVHIAVSDTGCGIPAHQQDKVFSKFFRASNVVSGHTEGTGLGLYLVYSLVQALGGTITFVSRENSGSTFMLTLPVTTVHHA